MEILLWCLVESLADINFDSGIGAYKCCNSGFPSVLFSSEFLCLPFQSWPLWDIVRTTRSFFELKKITSPWLALSSWPWTYQDQTFFKWFKWFFFLKKRYNTIKTWVSTTSNFLLGNVGVPGSWRVGAKFFKIYPAMSMAKGRCGDHETSQPTTTWKCLTSLGADFKKN